MKKIRVAIIGYGTVGSGLVGLIKTNRARLRAKYGVDFLVKTICDRSIRKKKVPQLPGLQKTSDIEKILKDPSIDVVVELIGGMNPAKRIVSESLKQGKHVVTANKELIANNGKQLFKLARKHNSRIYFESAVGAGIPIIKTVSEGLAGDTYKGIYGIINGTCNYILTEMSDRDLSFQDALKDAQQKGFAESNPKLDINGMDSAHKLAILVYLAFRKNIPLKDIYTEGISHISHDDIEHAQSLNLTIKLLAIAKKTQNAVEARVHPTLISQDHSLASIEGIDNAVYLDAAPVGNILLSGEGAGQMTAAAGVFSDLINLATTSSETPLLCNDPQEDKTLKIRRIDDILTKFYLRFNAIDKPGVLAKITTILGKHGIGINSVRQKVHNPTANVPIIMLTDYTTEKILRSALRKIHKLSVIQSKPIAIRMEKLW